MTEREQAKILLADAINADATSIPDDARLGFLEPWDSLAHLRFASEASMTWRPC
jgi:hypothetical protein